MTIDANIIIGYLHGDQAIIHAIQNWLSRGKNLFLSTVVETEVLSFQNFTEQELSDTENFLETVFTSIAFDKRLAKIAAAIRREIKIKFPDAAIAATAIYTKTPLVTRNIRDFKKIKELSLVEV